jgi:hypothetical protein
MRILLRMPGKAVPRGTRQDDPENRRLPAMTPPQTYLILIKDGNLALSVGVALEDRLLRDGHCALSLVPAVRGSDFVDTVGDRDMATQFGPWAATRPPQVVALYEDGLLPRLESLGLAAYIGIPREEDWRIIGWANGSGAMLLPVATARDLVEAVADHTPWSQEPRQGPDTSRRSGARRTWSGGPLLSRRVEAASYAGSLLLVSMPSTAALAATSPARVPGPVGAANPNSAPPGNAQPSAQNAQSG